MLQSDDLHLQLPLHTREEASKSLENVFDEELRQEQLRKSSWTVSKCSVMPETHSSGSAAFASWPRPPISV